MSGKHASPASSNPAPADLWLCFAVREEAAFVQPGACPVLVTGMGAVNASHHLQSRFHKATPRLLLTCGFAGALNPALPVGTVLFHSDPSFPPHPQLLASGAQPALFHATDQVVVTAREKRRLRETTGADAVEMESHVLRTLCHQRGIPSATVRVVSDAADEDMPVDFNRLMTPRMTLSFTRLALALAARPGRVRGLLQLQRNTRLAARNLAHVLHLVIANL